MSPIMSTPHTTWWIVGAAALTAWSAIASPGILTVAAGITTVTAAAFSVHTTARSRP